MVKARNDQKYIDERRYAKQLKVTASAVMFLGVWTVIKALMLVVTGDDLKQLEAIDNSVAVTVAKIIMLLTIAIVFMVIVLSMRFIILKGALKEADKKIEKNGYLVCAVLLMMIGLFSLGSFIYSLVNASASIELTNVASIVLDMTSFAMLLEMFVSAMNLRKCRAEIEESEGASRS